MIFDVKLSRVLTILLLVLIVSTAAYAWFPPFRLLVLVAMGHSPVCPLGRAVRSGKHRDLLTASKDRILRASRFVRTDEQYGLELWNTPKGEFWIPVKNQFVLPFNLAEMDQKVYGSGEHFVHPGDIVLDCGASDGDFSREALHAGAKLVVAIELSPQSIECLRRNLANDIASSRAVVYPKGVWDKDDQMMLNVSDLNFAANSVVMRPQGSHNGLSVPLTTIDHLVAELGLPRVDFIKMDVEGAEVRAIAGAHDTLTRNKPRLAITTEHNPDDEVTIPRAVRNVRSDYQVECGPCLEANGQIRADVLYFY
ncbi:MAG TPA: FkbM family methyltransferase [Bryobacteraceae bacterium]|nr:FkbM family methyltransferase [Bryobacteraceae bacterium]